MTNDGSAIRFEAHPGLEGIQRAVEPVPQRNGDTHGQETSRRVVFGTSSGHLGLPGQETPLASGQNRRSRG